MSRAARLAILLVLIVSTVWVCSPNATAQYATQMPVQLKIARGTASGAVQNVANGILTIVTDQPAFGLARGTKVSFALNTESMVFDGTKGQRASIPQIQNYRRARVQYVVKGDRRVAVHIRLYEPIQVANSQPPTMRYMAEAQARIRRADALYSKGDFEGAITEYRQALALDPNYVNARNNLGNALDKLGRSDEAIREYREAIRILPPYAVAHHNLALALNRRGDRQAAVEEERLACAFEPATYCPQETQGTLAGSRVGTFRPGPTKKAEGPYFDRNGRQWDSERDFNRICNVPSIASSSMPSTCPH